MLCGGGRSRRIFSSNTFAEEPPCLDGHMGCESLCKSVAFTGVEESQRGTVDMTGPLGWNLITVLLGAGFLLSLDIPPIAWRRAEL